MKPVAHGGDLGEVARRFPDATRPWLDLSTGINPVAYPVGLLPAESWSRLPAHSEEQALIAAAARRYGIRDPATLVAAPGTQALIQLLPRLFPKSRVAVVGPTYEEHAFCWARQGHDVTVVPSLARATGFDVTVVVNPDNPTGRLLPPTDLGTHRGFLVVDEAFIDFLPAHASIAGNLLPDAVVLRSFGKTYGLAGVRLGFAIAQPDMAARLRAELGPWTVAGPALEIGRRALSDDLWLQRAAERLEMDSARLDALLMKAGFTVLGGTSLFRFVSHVEAPAVLQRLGRHGIHVRSFADRPMHLRFGLPGDEASFHRVATALGV